MLAHVLVTLGRRERGATCWISGPEKSTLGVIVSSSVYRRGRIRRAKTKSRARVGPEEGSSGFRKATKGGFNRGGPCRRLNNEA